MKFIYKTKNLALTALVGAALAMGTPAAMAQNVDDNVTPTPDDQTSTGNYQEDKNLLKYYYDFVKYESERYQQEYPEEYEEIFAPTVKDVISQIEEMLQKVEDAKKASDDDETAYVSPITDEFKDDLFKEFKQLSEDAIYINVAREQDKVQALGASLNETIAQLSAMYEESVAPEVTEPNAEEFFLAQKDADAIADKLSQMEGKIAEATEKAQQVDFEKFDSPVTEAWVEGIKDDIQAYYDKSEGRINLAKAMLQLHDQNVDYVMQLEEKANETKDAAIEHAKAVLGEEIQFTAEDEEFFGDEPDFDKVLQAIEVYRKAMVEAAKAAQKANWQSYDDNSLAETIPAIEAAMVQYTEDAGQLVLRAQAMLQEHDEDVELIQALEGVLQESADKISEKYNATIGEDVELDQADQELVTNVAGFDAIQAQIEQLRQAVVAEYERAAADHWQNYDQDVTGVKEAVPGIQEEIVAYEEAGLDRIDNALATIEQHDKDIEVLTNADNALADNLKEIQALYAEKLEPEIGEPTDEAEAFFYDEETFNSIQKSIDGLRDKVAKAYAKAVETNMLNYSSPIPENWTDLLKTELQNYYDECEYRINNAQAMIGEHSEDVEKISAVETALADAFNAVAENLKAKLGDVELTEEEEAFFVGEATYNEIAADIEALRAKAVEAYDTAAADNWQSYTSDVADGITPIDEKIQKYQDDTEYLANNAQANMQQHDEDVEYIDALEGLLAEAANAIAEKYNATVGEDVELDPEDEAIVINSAAFDAIQAQIEKLRQAVVAEATVAQENNWQSYSQEATGVEEAIPGIQDEINAYEQTGLNRVDTALATIEQHDKDVATLQGLEGKLMAAVQEAQTLYAEKLEAELGEPTEEAEEFFYDEEAFNALQKNIDDARKAMVEAYDAALTDNLETYESPVTEEFTSEFEENLQAYADECIFRINKAEAMLELHSEDVEMITNVETSLTEAFNAVVENMNSKLGEEELTEEQEAFFVGETTYNEIAGDIDALRAEAVAAYDEAAANNWQEYTSKVSEGISAIDEKIQQYQDDTEYLANNAQANMQQHDEDVEYIDALEGLLAEAANAISEKYNSLMGEDVELSEEEMAQITNEATFDAIQAQIEKLREAVVAEATVAQENNWQSYSQEATGVEEAIPGIQDEINAYQETGVNHVEAVASAILAHDKNIEIIASLETKLMNAVSEAQALYAEKLEEILGEANDEFFFDEKGFDAIQGVIDNERLAVVKAYEETVANDYDEYVSPVTEEWVASVEAQIQDYADQCEYRINNALAQIQLHDEDVELIQGLDTELFDAVVAVQGMMQEKLGEEIEISDSMAAFLQDEMMFDEIQSQIDTLRKDVVTAYDQAAASNWQNYNQETSGVKEHAYEIEQTIAEYKDECEYRVNNAVANIQLHGEDAEMIFDLESSLMNTFNQLAEEVEDNVDADILEGIRDYLIVDGYDSVVAQIEALRAAMVEQYDVAAADNWQKYEQQVVPNASAIDEAIAQYNQQSGERILNALESIEAHQYDLDLLLPLDEMLGDGIAQLMEEHPELFEDGSEFIDQYEQLSAQIEEAWNQIKAAADKAEADNWQSYHSAFSFTDAQALYAEVEDFLATAWGDVGTINLHRWEADNDAVIALESELMAAIQYIQANHPDFNVDPDFDAIQAAIDDLRHQMAQAYEDADAVAWDTYECPYTESDLEAVEAMIDEMIAHAQGTSGIEGVNATDAQPMIFSIDGKRLNAPIKGELNIFIYKDRVEKKIVK